MELAGPAEYNYREVAEFVSEITTVKTPFIDIPSNLAEIAGDLMDFSMNPMFNKDTVQQLMHDVVLKENTTAVTLADLGIVPTTMDKSAFDYLHRFRPGGHFTLTKGYY